MRSQAQSEMLALIQENSSKVWQLQIQTLIISLLRTEGIKAQIMMSPNSMTSKKESNSLLQLSQGEKNFDSTGTSPQVS